MPGLHNRLGNVYGRLTVLARADNDKHGNAQWTCRCDCGTRCVINGCCLQQGDTKSCGCYHSSLRPFESLYNRLRAVTSHPVLLSYDEFVLFTAVKECHYCGESIVWRPHYAGKGGWQLDRTDTKQGYSLSNCVVCCKRCNMGKGTMFSYDEWRQIGLLIRGWKK